MVWWYAVGLWTVSIIFTIIYFGIIDFTIEKIGECSSFLGQLGILFSEDIAQKCKIVGIMAVFAPLAYPFIILLWILAIATTGIYYILYVVFDLKNEGKPKEVRLACPNCNNILNEEELHYGKCFKCKTNVCTCVCHTKSQEHCEECAEGGRLQDAPE